MRNLFMLTAVVFVLFTGAAVTIVGTAIHSQQHDELAAERDGRVPR